MDAGERIDGAAGDHIEVGPESGGGAGGEFVGDALIQVAGVDAHPAALRVGAVVVFIVGDEGVVDPGVKVQLEEDQAAWHIRVVGPIVDGDAVRHIHREVLLEPGGDGVQRGPVGDGLSAPTAEAHNICRCELGRGHVCDPVDVLGGAAVVDVDPGIAKGALRLLAQVDVLPAALGEEDKAQVPGGGVGGGGQGGLEFRSGGLAGISRCVGHGGVGGHIQRPELQHLLAVVVDGLDRLFRRGGGLRRRRGRFGDGLLRLGDGLGGALRLGDALLRSGGGLAHRSLFLGGRVPAGAAGEAQCQHHGQQQGGETGVQHRYPSLPHRGPF